MSNGRSSAGELLHAPPAQARPRGHAAEELSRSEERFFKVFQASPVAIILRTLGEGRVIGMIIDITDRKRMENELMRSREQLRSLSARLQQIREEERIRIARELHDELGGFLTVLKLDLSSLGKEPTTASASFRQKVDSMAKTMVAA